MCIRDRYSGLFKYAVTASLLIFIVLSNQDIPVLILCNSSLRKALNAVLHQLDQKIIYPHYDFKHLTEKYFEIGMKLDDFLIQLVKYCNENIICALCDSSFLA